MPFNVRMYEYPHGKQVRIYEHDIFTRKESEDSLLQLEYMIAQKNAINPFTNERYEIDFEEFKEEWREEKRKEKFAECKENTGLSYVEKKKFDNSNRAKNRIFELSRANDWQWFITLTFDRQKVDATDYKKCCRIVTQFMNNMRKRYAPDLKYLLLPELHKDGKNFHFHGLLADCGSMEFVDSGIEQNGKTVYNLGNFHYGFTTATEIEDTRRVSTYITKYVTKQLNVVLSGCRRYLKSNNLAEPTITEYQMTKDQIMDMMISVSEDIVYMKQTNGEFGSIKYLELSD